MKRLIVVFFNLMLISWSLWAQEIAPPQISGAVKDTYGKPIANAEITAAQTATGLVRTAVSDADGYYIFRSLPLGPYQLRVSGKGFITCVKSDIELTVNGETVVETVDARKTLVDFLRDDLFLTGSHVGCEHGVCGACTVRVNGAIVRGCLMLAAQCDGATVETIEGVSDMGEIADLQTAFETRNALQCGFCTPGMLLTAQELLAGGGVPSREKIREQISGNYCRCTGYHAIVDAIEAVAQARAGAKK